MTPATLTIRLRDATGEWDTDSHGGPVTITICSRASAPSTLPFGSVEPKQPYSRALVLELRPIIDRVVDWSGFEFRRQPVICTQTALLAVLRGWPHMRKQVEDGIRDFDNSGVT
jgi:hypothetical protein